MTATPSDERLRERVEQLEAELARRSAALGHLQTITKTFVALSLHDREAICDTLLALICSFLGFEHGLIAICDPANHRPRLAARYGLAEVDDDALLDEAAVATYMALLDDRVAQRLDGEALRRRWPAPPAPLADGFATVTVDIQDRAVGVIAVAGKRSGEPIADADVELLAVVGGLAALVIANGDAYQAQQALLGEVARQAEAARREATEHQRTLAELDAQLLLVEQQRVEIRELSTPILELWDHVLVLPMIGNLDGRRSFAIMEQLLEAIVRRQARFAIIDVTGVEQVDTQTANYLIKIINSAALLGTRCVLTGIRPAVAQTLTVIGIELGSVVTLRNLRRGLEYCIHAIEARRGRR